MKARLHLTNTPSHMRGIVFCPSRGNSSILRTASDWHPDSIMTFPIVLKQGPIHNCAARLFGHPASKVVRNQNVRPTSRPGFRLGSHEIRAAYCSDSLSQLACVPIEAFQYGTSWPGVLCAIRLMLSCRKTANGTAVLGVCPVGLRAQTPDSPAT
ncbi:hypothetical protein BT67DRAFT_122775 [Trichocladium antarcticum]|uniref:Uncharacterized protein n=1 Tax=Trichocladium antarcticum TaxID=1450529 RepID=A0AAN6URV2_9PEZI|nr:hypothetical protein BT67DRAFT_122775 [Trichocladium antarcticum]